MKSEILLQYFQANRQVGHTTAIIKGAENTDCLIVAANEQHARMLRQQLPKNKIVTLNNENLRGRRKALVVDNYALIDILSECHARINYLEKQLKRSQKHRVYWGQINLLCFLFGHTGNETESEWHCCSRCQMHAYHCVNEYDLEGVVFWPWRWVRRYAKNLWEKLRFKFRRDKFDDVPF